LNADGSPSVVQRTLVRPPESRIGPLTEAERTEQLERSPFKGRFDQAIDRESAYEQLAQRAEELTGRRKAAEAAEAAEAEERASERSRGRRSNRQGAGEALVKSAVRTIGRQLGSRLVRGVLGSLLGKR
ncbi:MAG: DUF853 domain-containing protein, partial [Gammaproteobacteria bacterium]|nr:DUF853 domain-containing protein [Gammaproteobacteria bacterium]